jgi:endonuclease III-like uncharacterized protein
MDKNFIEFWGNSLICSAKNQQQLEDMAKWFTESFTGFQEMNRIFSRMLGIEAPKAPDYLSLWEKSMNEFLNTYREFFSMIDLVPRKSYQDLEEENRKLKQRIAELEKQRPLHSIIEEEIKMAKEGVKGFQGMVEEQSRQFQKMMGDMGKAFSTTSSKAATEKSAAKDQRKPASRKKKPT